MDDSSQQRTVDYDESTGGAGQFCRLCFTQIHELHRIFPAPNGTPNRLLVRKIEFCTGIAVNFATDSNASICAKCIGLTEELFRFKQLCGANERWLKMDDEQHVASSDFLAPPTAMINDGIARPGSSTSLLTIETEQLQEEFGTCDEPADPMKHSIELSNPVVQDKVEPAVDSNRVTSSSCMRARRPTTIRTVPVVPPTAMVTIKSENDCSDCSDTRDDSQSSSQSRDNTPSCDISTTDTEGYRASSTAFSLVPGTKSRSGRLYLVYKGYRYSNYQSKCNVYRCTHRTPVYCRAKVLLKDNRVFEINDNTHQHPLPRRSVPSNGDETSPKSPKKKDVKISLVLRKHLPEREASRRHSGTALNSGGSSTGANNWFIKANRKTVDGFTYTFCGLRKDGLIRLKCITKGCGSRIYMYSNGDLTPGTRKRHSHAPHAPE